MLFDRLKILCRKALTYAERHGLIPYRIDALQQLGNFKTILLSQKLAVQLQEQALELSQQIGDKFREERTLSFLGECTSGWVIFPGQLVFTIRV